MTPPYDEDLYSQYYWYCLGNLRDEIGMSTDPAYETAVVYEDLILFQTGFYHMLPAPLEAANDQTVSDR